MRTPNLLGKNGIGAGKQITTKRIIAVLIMLMCCSLAFSQNNNSGTTGNSVLDGQITTWSNKITGFLGSSWVKAIALVALVAEAIGIVVGGQQGGGTQVFKKFAPWIVGTIVLLMASGICNYMYASLDFSGA